MLAPCFDLSSPHKFWGTAPPHVGNTCGKPCLATTVKTGFPNTRHQTPPSIQEYRKVREYLTINDHIVLLDKRIVIPHKFRKQILNNLHSAHQGTSMMQAGANKSMYWPGINNNIKTFHDNCRSCSYNVPSQSKEPLISSPTPDWSFQQICGDYFDYQGHSYLAIAQQLSGWLCLYHFKPGSATSQNLITNCWSLFMNYGTPKEFSSDGGPQFTSTSFQNFLKTWGVQHRLSSMDYLQFNGRAVTAVKTVKCIIWENTSNNGSINK